MTLPILISVFFVAISFSSFAHGCSCRPGTTLAQLYERADNILIAKITGCAQDRLSPDDSCRSHGWTFETVEDLKGTDAAVRALPSDSGPVANTCDISLELRETYLLFLSEGRTYLCSGTASLDGKAGVRKMREVEILRAYRDGTIDRITDPWHFTDSESGCVLFHQLDGVSLRFLYMYAARPMEGAGPIMTLHLAQPFDLVGPTVFEVNGERIPLTRHTVEPSRAPAPSIVGLPRMSIDSVRGDKALALLDTMSEFAAISVSGMRATPHTPAEQFHTTANTTQIRDAVAQFKACVAAHSEP